MNECSVPKWKTLQVLLLLTIMSFAMAQDDNSSSNNANTTGIKFYLYPLIENAALNVNNPVEMNFENVSKLEELGFNESIPTVMLIHGHGSNYLSPFPQETKTAYLSTRNFNVIIIDWEKVSGSPHVSSNFDPMIYSEAYKHVPTVGQAIADFIEIIWAVSTNASYCALNYHLIGLDLGAHAAGVASWFLQTSKISEDNSNPLIRRITALDPSALIYQVVRVFSFGEPLRLDSNDACFVDAIHTDNSVEGFLSSVGHADFYPNGGGLQPGCLMSKLSSKDSKDSQAVGSCNHNRAWKYFTKSITDHSKTGCQCSSYLNFPCRKSCATSAIFGQECPLTARGKYFLDIKNED